MTLNSILLALDGSCEARYASEAAWHIADSNQALVAAQHVVDSTVLWKLLLHHKAGFIGSGVYFEAYNSIVQVLRSLASNLIDAYNTFVPSNLTSSVLISEGAVVQELLKELEGRDLLVIGHRHGGDMHYLEPSVAAEVVLRSTKPVLVVQEQPKPWTAARLVLSGPAVGTGFIDAYLALTDSLALRKEIYHATSADAATVSEVSRLVKEHAGKEGENVIVQNAGKEIDWVSYGVTSEEGTLIVVPQPLAEAGRTGAPTMEPGKILELYKGDSILFLPAELSRSQRDSSEKTIAANA